MQKGVVFTIEAIYILVIVFAALIMFISSMESIAVPSYGQIQAMKVAHDMGEANTSSAPPGYALDDCEGKTTAVLPYYGTGEVCMK